MKIQHQLLNSDLFIPQWNVKHLFLGTFNPQGGDTVSYFYGRSRNQTWPTLSKIFKTELNPNNSDFFEKIKTLANLLFLCRIDTDRKRGFLG